MAEDDWLNNMADEIVSEDKNIKEIFTENDSKEEESITYLKSSNITYKKFDKFTTSESEIIKNAPKNTWTNCPGSTFNVRTGPNYKKNHKKIASKNALYNVFKLDAYQTNKKIRHIIDYINIDNLLILKDKNTTSFPELIICNFIVPLYKSEKDKFDGKSAQIIIYARINLDLIKKETNATKRLKEFFESNLFTSQIRNKLKGIGKLMNINKAGFNILTRKFISAYNGKPFMLQKSSTFYYNINKYFYIDIDINLFGIIAKKGFDRIKNDVKNLICDFCILIEADSDDDLPENVLMGLRFFKIDLFGLQKFDEKLIENGKNKNKGNNYYDYYLKNYKNIYEELCKKMKKKLKQD